MAWDLTPRKKPWRRTARNYSGIALEALRREVDAPYMDAKEALTEAYYHFWRRGASHPVLGGCDLQADLESTAAYHAMLDTYIDDCHLLAIHAANMAQPAKKREPTEQYDHPIRDEKTGAVTDTRLAVCARRKAAVEAAGIAPVFGPTRKIVD